MSSHQPLAERLRPRTLDEVVGQKLSRPDSPLRRALQADKPQSLVLWGPPGVGKTSIAKAIAHEATAEFEQLSAVTAGIKDLREVIARAQKRVEEGSRTLLFIDEIARWTKAQQDALLPHVEEGTVVLVGATTEHPGYELNRALLSRLTVYTLDPLDENALGELIDRAFTDPHGLDAPSPYSLSLEARDLLFLHSDGDARTMLNALEAAAALQPDGGELTDELIASALGRRQIAYDKGRDEHYATASALIKSIRGGSADAALYYLARMQAGGEDPTFVARRLVIAASEEVGMARPGALSVATSGFEAVRQVGPPECWINLAHIVCYLCACPKSWASYKGLRRAQEIVENSPLYPIPPQLRNASTSLDRAAGHGEGYVHASEEGADRVEFLPRELRGRKIYHQDF